MCSLLTVLVNKLMLILYVLKGGGNMATTSEAQRKAVAKCQKEKVEEIKFRVPVGQKVIIKSHADDCGESVNAFLMRAVTETMERDKVKSSK